MVDLKRQQGIFAYWKLQLNLRCLSFKKDISCLIRIF